MFKFYIVIAKKLESDLEHEIRRFFISVYCWVDKNHIEILDKIIIERAWSNAL
jgi:hypothetical protein